MGLLSAIGSFVSSCCSAVGGMLSAAVSGVCSCVKGVLSSSLSLGGLLKTLATVIPPPYNVIVRIVGTILNVLGIGNDKKQEELGYQMQECDKSPDEFTSFKEYEEYLDEHYPIDEAAKDKISKMSENERNACKLVGIAGSIKKIQQLGNMVITPEFLGLFGKQMSVGGRELTMADKQELAANVVTSLKERGETTTAKVVDLVEKKPLGDDFSVIHGAIQHGIDSVPALKGTEVSAVTDVLARVREENRQEIRGE